MVEGPTQLMGLSVTLQRCHAFAKGRLIQPQVAAIGEHNRRGPLLLRLSVEFFHLTGNVEVSRAYRRTFLRGAFCWAVSSARRTRRSVQASCSAGGTGVLFA